MTALLEYLDLAVIVISRSLRGVVIMSNEVIVISDTVYSHSIGASNVSL